MANPAQQIQPVGRQVQASSTATQARRIHLQAGMTTAASGAQAHAAAAAGNNPSSIPQPLASSTSTTPVLPGSTSPIVSPCDRKLRKCFTFAEEQEEPRRGSVSSRDLLEVLQHVERSSEQATAVLREHLDTEKVAILAAGQRQVGELRSEMASVQRDVAELKASLAQEVEKLRGRLESYSSGAAAAPREREEDMIRSMDEKVQHLSVRLFQEVDHLKTSVQSLERKEAVTSERCSTLQDLVASHQTKSGAHQSLLELETRLEARLVSATVKCSQSVAEIQATAEDTAVRLAALQARADEHIERFISRYAVLDEASRRIEKLETKITELRHPDDIVAPLRAEFGEKSDVVKKDIQELEVCVAARLAETRTSIDAALRDLRCNAAALATEKDAALATLTASFEKMRSELRREAQEQLGTLNGFKDTACEELVRTCAEDREQLAGIPATLRQLQQEVSALRLQVVAVRHDQEAQLSLVQSRLLALQDQQRAQRASACLREMHAAEAKQRGDEVREGQEKDTVSLALRLVQ
eukprot:TRINITY_DN11819_c0_g1_i1.p1 TRINITY_DN11819_c0_g1~~TRINITY_DN11819_c0_g1_i1.p1  ORF type:complete len:528 (-),score=104.31 TRINITY_DN11819_c0_g1_i1:65-1648(-)